MSKSVTVVEHRWCKDIGMFAVDRPIYAIKATAERPGAKPSCLWRTKACEGCYNNKLYDMYQEDMDGRDVRNEQSWQAITGEGLREALSTKRSRQTSRLRLMTRGEAFRDPTDIPRVRDICNANPEKDIWVPTRSWRSPLMRPHVRALQDECPNLRLQASIDHTNTDEEIRGLIDEGWSLMFWGDNERTTLPGRDSKGRFAQVPMHRCAKTWAKEKGACAETCNEEGCFDSEQTFVHLKGH